MTNTFQRLSDLFQEEKGAFLAFIRRQAWEISVMDAEDLLSETFSSLLDRADLVAEVESLTAYLYRALRNRITDAGRRKAREPRHEAEPELLEDPGAGAEEQARRAEFRQRYLAALRTLPPREREVWEAVEGEGTTFRTLAEASGEPLGTLLARKHRARARLRRHLNDFKGES